ncbi:hypothetical protein EJ110_NYTH38571 [Nymphaea thermarum]|nr:hypothetical protein EJ110_NYTH38571 [Nymphaea thermarum]
MLLRSSSTPILGSLLSSIPESPNAFDGNAMKHSCSEAVKKLSFHGGSHHHFHRFSCNSSPINHIVDWPTSDWDSEFGAETGGRRGVRRVQSDGNLQGLAGVETERDDFHNLMPFRSSRRPNSQLETILSFSLSRNGNNGKEEEDEEEGGRGSDGGGNDLASIGRTITFADGIISVEGSFNFPNGEIHGQYLEPEDNEEGSRATLPFLAKGAGIGLVDPAEALAGGNDGNNIPLPRTGGNGGGDEADIEKYYQTMLAENPSSPLFLRNYAQYLYQTKRDYQKAEEFYSRAILVEPGDGEILSQYAKLIWEVHHNHDRAASYFEQSVQAAPEDSHVLAAYASFLWDTEESGDGDEEQQPKDFSQFPNYHGTALASTNS